MVSPIKMLNPKAFVVLLMIISGTLLDQTPYDYEQNFGKLVTDFRDALKMKSMFLFQPDDFNELSKSTATTFLESPIT